MLKLVLFYLVLLLLGMFFQSGIVHGASSFWIVPDIVLILVVVLALHRRSASAVVFAFSMGLLSDMASAKFLGPNAGAAVVAYCFVALLSDKVYASKSVAVAIVTFITSLVKIFTTLVFLSLYVSSSQLSVELWTFHSLKVAIFESIFSALLSPFVLFLIRFFTNQGSEVKVSRASASVSFFK